MNKEIKMDMKEKSGYRNGQLVYPISVTEHVAYEGYGTGNGGNGGNGGGTGQPAPNSVGSAEIVDGSITLDDLNPDIEADNSDIDEIFAQVSTQPTTPTQPLVVEEEEEP